VDRIILPHFALRQTLNFSSFSFLFQTKQTCLIQAPYHVKAAEDAAPIAEEVIKGWKATDERFAEEAHPDDCILNHNLIRNLMATVRI